MLRVMVALGAALAFTGCGGCGGDDPLFTILDPGTGDPNTASLAPMSVGYVYEDTIIDGMIEGPHGPTYRAGTMGSPVGRYYLVNEDGVFNAGETDYGLLDAPMLIVPATVRLGMRWTTRNPANGASIEFRVTGRTPGNPPVWVIESGFESGPPTGYFEYEEGRGPARKVRRVLRDPSDTVPPARRPMALEELPYNSDLVLAPSMVRFGDDPAVITGYAGDGRGGMCGRFDGDELRADPAPPATGPFTRTQGVACVTSPFIYVNENQVDVTTQEFTGHASGAHVAPDGTVTWIPRYGDGGVIPDATVGYIGDSSARLMKFSALALVPGASGRGEVLYDNGAQLGGVLIADGDVFERRHEPQARTVDSAWPAMGPRIEKVITINEPDGTAFLIETPGMLWVTRMGNAGPPPTPVPVGSLTGMLSVQTTEHGTEVLRVSADGGIDELRVDGLSLVVTHLADIELKPGQAATGAFRWREVDGTHRLVVTTVEAEGINGLLRARIYRSTSTLPPSGEIVPVHSALKLVNGTMRPVAGALDEPWMCWSDAGPVDAASWNLPYTDDLRVEVVEVDEAARCVALMLPSSHPSVGDQTFIVGSVPGVGRIEATVVGHDRGPISVEHQALAMAALPGSGFVTNQHLYSSFGVFMGFADQPFDAELAPPVRDLAGGGLWYTVDGVLRRLGRTTQRYDAPQGLPLTLELAAAGGGVVVSSGSTWYFVSTAGQFTPVATPAANHTPCTRMLDGTICGATGDQWYCQPPSGPEVLSGPLPTATGDVCDAEAVLADGTVMAVLGDQANTQALYRLEGNGTATHISNEGSFRPLFARHGADGTAWFVFADEPRSVRALRVDRSGFVGSSHQLTSRTVIDLVEVVIGQTQLVLRNGNDFSRVQRTL